MRKTALPEIRAALRNSLVSETQMGIEIKNFNGDGELQLVHGYGDGGFRVTSQRYQGDLLLLPRLTREWRCPEPTSLRFADLEPLLGEVPPPLFLLGAGPAPQQHLPELAADLKANGINLELMSTAAACRTWNVLMSEGRNAAAALIAI
ncbi:MAG: hypothetical protein EVA91_11050 [SAR116 cluster bacterium]|nr:MAG: hypothetical protein EVA91_11050 [SAR116 cluster bacterium]|tara:strand:+ start:1722 stop:2168 length:447 start_codon:yes stop_codon:yes gene_type:complete